MASHRDIRPDAPRLVEQLPESSGWDDLMHEIYVRQAIESGLADAEANRVLTVEEVRARLGLAVIVYWTATALGHIRGVHEYIAQHSPVYA